MANLRDLAFDADDLGGELVTVPEWSKNGVTWTAWVKGLEAGVRNNVALAAQKPNPADPDALVRDPNVFYAGIIQAGAYDPDNKTELIFAPDDLHLLLGRSGRALDRLAKPILRLSGMDDEDLGKAVVAAGEASSGMANGDSTSQ